MGHIFISYQKDDKNTANYVCQYLEELGTKCWIAPRDIPPGVDYSGSIIKAIRESSALILIASERVISSRHILSELAIAFDAGIRLIPFFIEEVTISDDMLYYLRTAQWINAYDDFNEGLRILARTKQEMVRWKTNELMNTVPSPKKASNISNNSIKLVTYQELLEIGYDALQIAERLVQNDYQLYSNISTENEGSPEQWAEYLSSFPETFRYLINDNNEIIGNWSFLSVSEEEHLERLRAGELYEESFSIDNTEFILFPGEYIGYLLNLSVNEGYNSVYAYGLLLNSFIEQLITFAENGIYIKCWYVNVFRKDHEAMYKRLGFKFLCANSNYGCIYVLEKTANGKFPGMKAYSRLKELYNEYFLQ